MFRRLLSATHRDSTLSAVPGAPVTEQQVAPVDQASLNLNKAVPAVKGFFPLNEPHVGSAYTNTVCPPLGEQRSQVDCQYLGHLHTEQGTPGAIPANYNQKCHFQEQDLGGALTSIFADRLVTFRQSPMCQYSSDRGHATDWHLVHLGVRTIQPFCYQLLS